MSTVNNEIIYEKIREDLEEQMSYEAVVKFDGEVYARISSESLTGLQEELYKLEKAEQRKIDEEYDARVDNADYMADLQEYELNEYYMNGVHNEEE
jgi:hypothetical protein